MKNRNKTFFIVISICAGHSHAASTVTFGPFTDTTAEIDSSGYGSTPASDYLGIVTSTTPLQIDAGSTTVSSGFTPTVGDVIGRDLASTGISYTGSTISWTLPIPALPSDYIAGTFDLSATFDASLSFLGNDFDGGSQSNALNFSLLFDTSSVDSFQGQAGTHTAASLSGSQTNGAPITSVTVTATFPDGNSFNAGSEEFRIYASSLEISGSYDVVPEPSSALFGGLVLLGLLRRRRSFPSF